MVNSTTILLLVAIGVALYWINQPCETTEQLENVEQEAPVVAEPVAASAVLPLTNSSENVPAPVEEELVETEEEVAVPVVEEETVNGMVGGAEGASLDGAFMGAVPPNTAVDQIDFNRQNQSEYESSQYLPQEVNDEWFDTDFTKAKYNLNDDKMINTDRYMIGVNTVGQSLKNPAYDIRGTIPNPKYTVSPWNNSTYEPDNNLKPLC